MLLSFVCFLFVRIFPNLESQGSWLGITTRESHRTGRRTGGGVEQVDCPAPAGNAEEVLDALALEHSRDEFNHRSHDISLYQAVEKGSSASLHSIASLQRTAYVRLRLARPEQSRRIDFSRAL